MFFIHTVLMFLMCVLIVIAAVIARKRADGWLMKHRVFAVLGVLSGLIGFSGMFYVKLMAGWPHFKTPHAIGGGIAVLLLLVTPALGFMATKGKLNGVHKIFGRITAILALLVLITGLDKLYDKLTAVAKPPVVKP